MADPEIRFKDEQGEECKIDAQNFISAVPPHKDDGSAALSTFIYVEERDDESDAAALPQVKITKGTPENTTPSWPDTEHPETHILVSTGSGANLAAQFYENAVKPILQTLFRERHDNHLVHETTSASTIQELTSDIFFPTANAGLPLRIVLLSGDGGIIDLVNGLLAHPASPKYAAPQVVLLPLGTANALYHSVKAKKEDKTWGLKNLAETTTFHPLPTFTAHFSPGAHLLVNEARSTEALPLDTETQSQPTLHGAVVCSWGMHASLVADSDTAEYRKYGVERFKMAAKEALYPADGSLPHAYQGRVSVLDANGSWIPVEEQEHLYVLATLVSNLEKPFVISPASAPLDGSFHLVRFGPCSGDEAMRLMGLAYQGGKHVEEEAVTYESIEGLRIEFLGNEGGEEGGRWRRVCVDGKIVRVEEGGWVEVRKGERRVLEVVMGS